jgi:ankyrin repeat protein
VDLQDDDRNNPLLLCGENGNVELLREVLRAKPNLGATNRYGGVALIPAADRGHVEMVRALLETDIDVDHVNNLGWTAVLETVLLGDGDADHVEILRMLLDAGADAAIPDNDGVTALEHARERGYAEMVELLS